mmetsp:Transcript_16838/g.46245  ORF Transcript_16838/g.46245 Transcript_16838/m.46245 type:complete len:142 (+) Transcript_16838:1381-1806(+)
MLPPPTTLCPPSFCVDGTSDKNDNPITCIERFMVCRLPTRRQQRQQKRAVVALLLLLQRPRTPSHSKESLPYGTRQLQKGKPIEQTKICIRLGYGVNRKYRVSCMTHNREVKTRAFQSDIINMSMYLLWAGFHTPAQERGE